MDLQLYPVKESVEPHMQRVIVAEEFALAEQQISNWFSHVKMDIADYCKLLGSLVDVEVWVSSSTEGGEMKYNVKGLTVMG